MYESHFGLSGPPFQLNPDPAFYFDSRGHSNALAYLKYGVYQGEGFIVVTGEIGAGKTTLVRTLLEGLDPERVVAAQVVSTQLESGDLLRSIIASFGVPPSGTTKAHLIATLEGFLTALAAQGKRALLIVDEAQNLNLEAIEELRMLSNFQLGKHALLQSFLIGQPELRVLLESKSMEQFRQRVIASCHLGPLDETETKSYIEHRLRRVGWTGVPAFEPESFREIHKWTGGIPRRVNLLCNRLLLGAFLSGNDVISGSLVEETAHELRGEVGEAAHPPPASRGPIRAPGSGGAGPVPATGGAQEVVRHLRAPLPPAESRLVCIVDRAVDYLKALAVAEAWEAQGRAPAVVVVHPGCEADWSDERLRSAALPQPCAEYHLGVRQAESFDVAAPLLIARFGELLEEVGPRAVLALGASDAVLACALTAHKKGVALLRADAGVRDPQEEEADRLNAVLLDRLADLVYTGSLTSHYTLYREGISSARVQCVGALMENVVHSALQRSRPAAEVLLGSGHEDAVLRSADGFALCMVRRRQRGGDFEHQMAQVGQVLAVVKTEIPIVWPVDPQTMVALRSTGMEKRLRNAGVLFLPELEYADLLALMREATCVLRAGPCFLDDEIAAMETPVIDLLGPSSAAGTACEGGAVVRSADECVSALHVILRNRQQREEQADAYWDGGPGVRLIRHWLHAMPPEPGGREWHSPMASLAS